MNSFEEKVRSPELNRKFRHEGAFFCTDYSLPVNSCPQRIIFCKNAVLSILRYLKRFSTDK